MSLRRAGSRQYPCHTPVVVPPERLNAPVSRAESVSGCSDSWLGSNPNSDANDHQRYEDHGHVDREPPGWLVLGLFGHGLVPLRTILQREDCKCEPVHMPLGMIARLNAPRGRAESGRAYSLNGEPMTEFTGVGSPSQNYEAGWVVSKASNSQRTLCPDRRRSRSWPLRLQRVS